MTKMLSIHDTVANARDAEYILRTCQASPPAIPASLVVRREAKIKPRFQHCFLENTGI
jgi:hypothetical protein